MVFVMAAELTNTFVLPQMCTFCCHVKFPSVSPFQMTLMKTAHRDNDKKRGRGSLGPAREGHSTSFSAALSLCTVEGSFLSFSVSVSVLFHLDHGAFSTHKSSRQNYFPCLEQKRNFQQKWRATGPGKVMTEI